MISKKCQNCGNELEIPENSSGEIVYHCSKCGRVVYYPYESEKSAEKEA